MKTYRFIICYLLLIFPMYFSGQDDEKLAFSLRHSDSLRPTYIELGFGSGYYNLRDFATSPVIYHGINGNFYAGRHRQDHKRESIQGFIYSAGQASIRNSNGLRNSNEPSAALLMSLDIIHTELYKLPWEPSERWNFKAGGMVNLSGNFRHNESLQNNALGLEAIGTLFASFKINRDVSRKTTKDIDWKLVEFQLIPRKRQLSWQMNIAVLNTTFRNGYAYMNNSSEMNDYDPFDNHEFNFFRGYRLSSSLEYMIYLKNQNAFTLKYVWDAYHTGDKTDKLELGRHSFFLSFLYNLNEKINTPEQ
ncbi:MAG: hypothetical protein R6U19_06025 [Bacteroidales bacterium]